jgi:hypothetical protein
VSFSSYGSIKEWTGDDAPKAKGEGEMLSVKVRVCSGGRA